MPISSRFRTPTSPTTVVLLGGGLVGLAGVARRRAAAA